MFRITLSFTLALFLFLSCSSDRPLAPTSPAGKATSTVSMPTNLRVENQTDTSVRLAWDAVAGATDYDVGYKKLGEKYNAIPHIGTATYADLNGLTPNTQYRWVVKADRGNESSRWASGGIFRTLPSGATQPIPTRPSLPDTTTLESQEDEFNIELVFIDPLTLKQRRWLRDVADRWEKFFVGVPEYTFSHRTTLDLIGKTITIPAGTRIDDIRIYVGTTSRQHPGWEQEAGGLAHVLRFRPDGNIPLVAVIRINENQIEEQIRLAFSRLPLQDQDKIRENMGWKEVFHHELGHAFGIGSSPAWEQNTVKRRLYDKTFKRRLDRYFFVGANALREYRQAHPHPHEEGIPLSVLSLSDPRPIHWHGGLTGEEVARAGELGWTLFDKYFNHLDGSTNITSISLGAFEDIGWQVKYEMAKPLLYNDEYIGSCWLSHPPHQWLDFNMDCN